MSEQYQPDDLSTQTVVPSAPPQDRLVADAVTPGRAALAESLSSQIDDGASELQQTRVADGRRTERAIRELTAWVKTLASAGVYATLIVTFVGQVARVEGHSMAPTLKDQDRLIVNKWSYSMGEPHVGDIVMLRYPNDPSKSFVKRVIAKEGDQLRIVAGSVYRNDVLLDDSFIPLTYRSHDDWGPEIIPEGYYFVLGDHRNSSSDSRHWRFVPKGYIIGKVQVRWWPLSDAHIF